MQFDLVSDNDSLASWLVAQWISTMATKADRQRNEQLTKATAEKVVGWKAVHKHNGGLIGKKQDKAGRWRKANLPDYAMTNARRMP